MPDHSHSHTRKRSRSPPAHSGHPLLSADDFFAKSLEFRFWLKNEKLKFIDQLDSAKSKKYFEKFVRQWNKGKLNPDYYNPPGHWRTTSGATSSHAWTFKDTTVLEREKAKRAVEEARSGPTAGASGSTARMVGPSLPERASSGPSPARDLADYQYSIAQERETKELDAHDRRDQAKRIRRDQRLEDADNKASGKDRLLEKRAENRRDRADYLREKDDPTSLEIDDRSLFGSSNSFQDAIQARNRAQERKTGKNSAFKIEKQLVMQEKMAAMKSKESETMAMFKAMAASKFGQGSQP